MPTSDSVLASALSQTVVPLRGGPEDFDLILRQVGEARCVLIGEATHGTHEFYRLRAQLTKRLIVEKGFLGVVVEGDWPESYRVNRYVRGAGLDSAAVFALSDFQRFPAWLWRNADVLDFVGWLRAHNDRRHAADKVGFYGLDLYSLHTSIAAVLSYIDTYDPAAASLARERYACFDQFGDDAQAYGYATRFGRRPSCEEAVTEQWMALRTSGVEATDEYFFAEQNARVVKNAEAYYRTMMSGHVASWNLRDTHMADTVDALLSHLEIRHKFSKLVIWAHNSHVGDARATSLCDQGEINIGQLMRERYPNETYLVGFSTYQGTVTAAANWDGAAERKRVRPGLANSYEALFHQMREPAFIIDLQHLKEAGGALYEPRLLRAIGVVYKPETERHSHYYSVCLPEQFDALLHLDTTRALEPLEKTARWERGEAPETFPTGI